MAEEELDGAKVLERLRLKNLSGKKELIEDLKKRKGQRSVLILAELLQDESWYLREQAVQALPEMGDEARGPVMKLLENGLWYTRAAAAKVLGKIGGPEAVDSLLDCLVDSNMTVQGAAAAALVDIAKSSSVEALASSLGGRPHDVKQKAVSRIALLDKEVSQGILSCWEREVAKPRREKSPRSEPPEQGRKEPGDGDAS